MITDQIYYEDNYFTIPIGHIILIAAVSGAAMAATYVLLIWIWDHIDAWRERRAHPEPVHGRHSKSPEPDPDFPDPGMDTFAALDEDGIREPDSGWFRWRHRHDGDPLPDASADDPETVDPAWTPDPVPETMFVVNGNGVPLTVHRVSCRYAVSPPMLPIRAWTEEAAEHWAMGYDQPPKPCRICKPFNAEVSTS